MGLSASKRHACALTFEVFARLSLLPPGNRTLGSEEVSSYFPRVDSEGGIEARSARRAKDALVRPVWALAECV